MGTKGVLLRFLVSAALIASTSFVHAQDSRGFPTANPNTLPGVQPQPGQFEIAEGEYAIFKEYGGLGPGDAQIFNFHEDWHLSQTADGKYEVQGTRSFESPKDFPWVIGFLVRLSPQLQLLEAQEETSLLWVPHSAPLTCVFLPEQLQCSTSGKDPRENPDISLSMDKPYAFSWPVSVFSLAALTRRSEHQPGVLMDVQFVDIEQPSNDLPILPFITNGTLRFMGPDKVVVAGKTWDSDRFELQAFLPPLPRKSLLWISKGGLLLVLEAEDEIGPKTRLELSRFRQTFPSSAFP